jgi:2-keto-4-pentenoate hydratase/2-oxohepta-3-ene-1,7-dioic acid hydratase in catechol pathway
MKICRFVHNNTIKNGVLKNEFIYPYRDAEVLTAPEVNIEAFDYLKKSEVVLLPPATPSKIVCVGRNYTKHAAELGNEVPKEPLLFLKAPSALIIEGEEIVLPPQSNQVEHEGELAVIIGRDCKDLADSDNPLDFVLGYTCLNDVTARDIQRSEVQFTRAKSFDTFCPISPFVETEADVSDVRVTTKVNGVIKQDGRTSEMVFSVPFLVKYISCQMSLNAGDFIATGTPSGVSKLNAGDFCEIEIEGIGFLRNTVKG